MATETINLGFVKSIYVGITAPVNTKCIWYDDNIGQKIHKVYNTVSGNWEELQPQDQNLQQVTNNGNTTTRVINITGSDGSLTNDGLSLYKNTQGYGYIQHNIAGATVGSLTFLNNRVQLYGHTGSLGLAILPSSGYAFFGNTSSSTPGLRLKALPAIEADDLMQYSQYTGLQLITEGSNTGYALKGEDRNNHGPIGMDSFDISISKTPSTTRGAIGNSSFAWGNNASAQGNTSIAMGYNSLAEGDQSVAIGFTSVANNVYGVAIGRTSSATDQYSVAIGYNATAALRSISILGNSSVQNSISIGYSSAVGAFNSIAIGNDAEAIVNNSIAIGYNSLITNQQRGIAIGSNTIVNGSSSSMSTVVIGNDAEAIGNGIVAIGHQASGPSGYSISIGNITSANIYSIAIGHTALSNNSYAISIGYAANSSGQYGIAIGRETVSSGQYAISIGHESQATTERSIAIGEGAIASTSTGTMAIGYSSEATGFFSTAVGYLTYASAQDAFAAGRGNAQANSSIAIGRLAEVTASASSGISIGASSASTSGHSIAIGSNTKANTSGSVAIGHFNESNSYGGTVLGLYADSIITTPETSRVNGSPLFIVGNGTSIASRTNAYVLNNDATSTQYGIASYAADYSANFTDRSLIDKGYVDNTTSSLTLQSVTDNGYDTTNRLNIIGNNGLNPSDGISINKSSSLGFISFYTESSYKSGIRFGSGNSNTTSTCLVHADGLSSYGLILTNQTLEQSGAVFGGNFSLSPSLRVSGSNAINNNEFVTLEQVGDNKETVISTIGTLNNQTVATNFVKFTGVGQVILTGIDIGSLQGKKLVITNKTGQELTIIHESTSSDAANTFWINNQAADLPLGNNNSVEFQYSISQQRWILTNVYGNGYSSHYIGNGERAVIANADGTTSTRDIFVMSSVRIDITAEQTAAQLNTEYPDAVEGFRVVCPEIATGGLVYEMYDEINNLWGHYPFTKTT